MKIGIWIYGIGTIITGILNIVWGAFDAGRRHGWLAKRPGIQRRNTAMTQTDAIRRGAGHG